MLYNILTDVVAEPSVSGIFEGGAGALAGAVIVIVVAAAVAIIIRTVNKKNKDNKEE